MTGFMSCWHAMKYSRKVCVFQSVKESSIPVQKLPTSLSLVNWNKWWGCTIMLYLAPALHVFIVCCSCKPPCALSFHMCGDICTYFAALVPHCRENVCGIYFCCATPRHFLQAFPNLRWPPNLLLQTAATGLETSPHSSGTSPSNLRNSFQKCLHR